MLVENLNLRSLRHVPRFFVDASTFSQLPANATYRPLVSLSLAVDYWLAGGLDRRVFHASQLALMALLWLALLALYRRVLDACQAGASNRYVALCGATWFSVHTLNSETMNLMHARSEILSALGLVGAFLLYLGSGRARRSGLHVGAMALGALAKPPAVIFGPLLFAWETVAGRWLQADAAAGSRPWRTTARRALRPALVPTLAGIATFWAITKLDAPGQTYGGGDRYHYALTQIWAWLHYLRLFVLPRGLTADSDQELIRDFSDTRVFAGAAALAALAWLAWRSARSRRAWPIAFGLVWFAAGLLPTSSVLPLAEPVNEHRPFLGLIGLVLAVVWGGRLLAAEALAWSGAKSPLRIVLPATLAIAVLVAHAAATHRRNEVWRTGESLWADVTEKSPENGRAWMNYGLAFLARGRWDEARRCFDRAQVLTPNYYVLEINLGVLAGAVGDPAGAERHFRRAVELAPRTPSPYFYLGRWLAGASRGPEAIANLRTATQLTSGYESALALLMDLYAARGDWASAGAVARQVLDLQPRQPRAAAYLAGHPDFALGPNGYETYFQAALAFGESHQNVESALAYRAALTLKPGDADALSNLGWTLGKLGFWPEAEQTLTAALRARPDFPLAQNNLAWVRSELTAPAGP